MGARRRNADEGTLVRRMNYSPWLRVEEDADYNIGSVSGTAINTAITNGTNFTLLKKALMVPGTLAFTFTDAASADATLTVEVEGYDADGQLRSELVSFSGAATVLVKQTTNAYMWLNHVKPIKASGLTGSDNLVAGYTNVDANSNPGAGIAIPGNPKAAGEMHVQYMDADTDPPATAAEESTTDFTKGIWFPEHRTGNRAYRFVFHPDRC